MKNDKLNEMTNEELIEKEKSTKVLAIILSTALLVLFISTILTTIKKGFGALAVVPIALLPILITLIKSWSDIKKEIKARNL